MSTFDKGDPAKEGAQPQLAQPAVPSRSSALEARLPRSRTYHELREALHTLHALPAARPGSQEFSNQGPIRLALLRRIELLLGDWRAEIEARERRSQVTDEPPPSPTLGDLINADKTVIRVAEKDWIALVHAIAAGNHEALSALFERTHSIVFTLIARITHDLEAAEALTVDVFADVWRRASTFDAGSETVVSWIMNEARRSLALDWVPAGGQEDVDEPIFEGLRSSLRVRVAQRIRAEARSEQPLPPPLVLQPWTEPAWRDVAPGISCKVLADDEDRERISMLVRLAPGTDYPSHRHAGVEELHLLHGELIVNELKLHAGDYHRAGPGTVDRRVWSGTGCTCVLTTSTRDVLR
jgi:DNA-directed RNA polymerase specialized sigma24 family protein